MNNQRSFIFVDVPGQYYDEPIDKKTIEICRRDHAIERVEAKNDPSPFNQALEDMVSNLRGMPLKLMVTSDTILPDIKRYGFSDGRVVGALMRHLIKDGSITRTPHMRNSIRAGNHCAPRRVYVNNLGQ